MVYRIRQRIRVLVSAALSSMARQWLRRPARGYALIRWAAYTPLALPLPIATFVATSTNPSSLVYLFLLLTATASLVGFVWVDARLLSPWLRPTGTLPARVDLPLVDYTPLASWVPPTCRRRPSRETLLRALDQWVGYHGLESSLDIRAGQCPWMLAALLLHVLEPQAHAAARADALDVTTSAPDPAHADSPTARPVRL